MTCVEFAKAFNVYIAFDASGYGQIFAKPPKLIKNMDFFISNGDDSKLLPCLVEDYDKYSEARRVTVIPPDAKEEDFKKEIKKMADDFKENDVIETNVEVVDVATWPSASGTEIHNITVYDGSHHFVWNTRSKTIPKVGEKKFLKAVIKGKTDKTDIDIPAYSVSGVKLLLPKK